MNVLLDVHADRCWLQGAVASNIAPSHEDVHVWTSTPSRCALRRMNLCLEVQIRLLRCRIFHPPNSNMDRSITTFGSILAPVTKFFTNFSSIAMFWTNFPSSPTFLLRQNPLHLAEFELFSAILSLYVSILPSLVKVLSIIVPTRSLVGFVAFPCKVSNA